MMSPLLFRGPVMLAVLVLASCRGEPVPVVDLSPLGDAIRFIAVAIVLAAIISGVIRVIENRDKGDGGPPEP